MLHAGPVGSELHPVGSKGTLETTMRMSLAPRIGITSNRAIDSDTRCPGRGRTWAGAAARECGPALGGTRAAADRASEPATSTANTARRMRREPERNTRTLTFEGFWVREAMETNLR